MSKLRMLFLKLRLKSVKHERVQANHRCYKDNSGRSFFHDSQSEQRPWNHQKRRKRQLMIQSPLPCVEIEAKDCKLSQSAVLKFLRFRVTEGLGERDIYIEITFCTSSLQIAQGLKKAEHTRCSALPTALIPSYLLSQTSTCPQ